MSVTDTAELGDVVFYPLKCSKLEDEILRPRTRDILSALLAAHPQDSERNKALVDFFKTGEAIP